MGTATVETRRRTAVWWLTVLVLAAVAFGMRLRPVLIGGGLRGRGDYDDTVYYTAAAGFVHGLLPYRDFVLLHPPGIVLALAPFAALARWTGEPDAFAVARVSFMLLGAVNAVLVAWVLRRISLVAALAGGMFYALYFPAVYAEHTTLLEPLATTCVLGAVALVTTPLRPARVPAGLIMAGVLLGASASIKIWGVVPAAAVIVWMAVRAGGRRAGWVTAGAALGAVVICLPFYATAPQQMWRLVVLSQLGRPPSVHSWFDRGVTLVGLTPLGVPAWWWLLLAAGAVVPCCVAAARTAVGRLAVTLLVATIAMLLVAPSWYQHYAAAAAGPLALVIGAGLGCLVGRVRRPATGIVVAVVLVGLMGSYGYRVEQRRFGRGFPVAALTASVAATPGCVTTDDPISLIELDVLRRNLDRGCPLVADLGGYNYAIQVGTTDFRDRAKNPAWQRVALDYLRSGDLTVVGIRFHAGFGYSKATAAEISSWAVRSRAGAVTVRDPASHLGAR